MNYFIQLSIFASSYTFLIIVSISHVFMSKEYNFKTFDIFFYSAGDVDCLH